MASSYASSRIREVEHRTTSACSVESAAVSIALDNGDGGGVWKLVAAGAGAEDGGFENNVVVEDDDHNDAKNDFDLDDDDYWTKMADDAAAGGGDTDAGATAPTAKKTTATKAKTASKATIVECRALASGTTIRVAPVERSHGGWSPEHFHDVLRLPESAKVGRGVVVLLEARSSECLAIALSPQCDYELGKTYVVHLGADGNTRTVLRRHVNYVECVESSRPCRVCSEENWVPYWIILQGGRLSAGIGRVPGKDCVGSLDDSMYDALRSGIDAVRYVGIGNSALRRNARDLRVRNVAVMGIPPHFGLGGVTVDDTGGFVSVLDMPSSSKSSSSDPASAPTDAELLAEYERERNKAIARASKFGIEYKEPSADAFLRWSEARRLRANPERGFVTGIDTFSAEEVAKADARRRRFATASARPEKERKRKGGDENDDEPNDGGGGENDEDGENGENDDDDDDEAMDDDKDDDVAEWEKTKRDPLPVEQAWENWKIVGRFRVDPPPSSASPGAADPTNAVDGGADDDGRSGGTTFASPGIRAPVVVPTKIHVFSIDWAPFKQIRTDDLMSYFRDYGPSYVEWLGELSCNVLFEDRHSAARAFRALSRELPSPPPPPSGAAAAEFAAAAVFDPNDDGGGEAMGDERGATANGDDDGEANHAMDAVVDGVGGEGHGGGGGREEGDTPPPDYGSMGWRFCKWTVRKVGGRCTISL